MAVKSEEEINKITHEMATLLQRNLPDGIGFTLFLFDIGTENGRLSYVSNANRHDMIQAIKEWIEIQRILSMPKGVV